MNAFPVKLSLVVPCYNEEETVSAVYDETVLMMRERGISFEMIFINDGSSDGTLDQLRAIVGRAHCPVRVIDFSRNFGKDAGIYAGLGNARGEYTVIMDGDMQQSPEVVLQMYDYLEQHDDVDCVAAVQNERREGAVLSFFKRSFYKIINRAASVEFVSGASDFRMMRRPMLEAVLSMTEYFRFSKGIFSFVGFKTYYMPYLARERGGGVSKWSFWKLMRYAMDGIIGFTTAPLKFITAFGAVLSGCSFIYLLIVIINRLFFETAPAGYPTIVSLILMLGGLQLLALGVIGEYLGRNYVETKRRPIFIQRKLFDSEQMAQTSGTDEQKNDVKDIPQE